MRNGESFPFLPYTSAVYTLARKMRRSLVSYFVETVDSRSDHPAETYHRVIHSYETSSGVRSGAVRRVLERGRCVEGAVILVTRPYRLLTIHAALPHLSRMCSSFFVDASVIKQRTPGSGKKRVPSLPGPRSGSVFNLEEVIASIEGRDEQRQQSDSLGSSGSSSRRGSLPAGESIPKKDRYRVSGAAFPLLATMPQSVAPPTHLPARTPGALAEVAPRAKRQSTRWAPPPASGADALDKASSPPVAGATSAKSRSSSKAGAAENPVRGASDGTRGARAGKSGKAGARGSSPGGASLRTPKRSSRTGSKSKRIPGGLSSSSSSGSGSSNTKISSTSSRYGRPHERTPAG